METERLTQFLRDVRERCSYESGFQEIKLPDGRRRIGPYQEGELSTTDIYSGFNLFEGTREIREKGSLVWKVEYRGEIEDLDWMEKSKAERLYGFLKKMLRKFPHEGPFQRGPIHGEDEILGLYYICSSTGNIKGFTNEERIFIAGEEYKIYTYADQGGLVDQEGNFISRETRTVAAYFPKTFN